jgi:hypothetical protein
MRPALSLAAIAALGAGLAAAAPAAATPDVATPDAPAAARRWGEEGHRMVGEAAARALPADVPPFLRAAAAQLAYLNPEPDRWRAPRDVAALDPAMDPAYAPDHFVDLELLPEGALLARDRYAYADSLRAARVDPSTAGMLPYRIYELTARLREEFRLWRHATDADERRWIEARIVNDAGVLGHYVADAANPHHTTIHYNGWRGPNPKGYATSDGFHSRFESQYVRARLTLADVTPLVAPAPRTLLPLRDSVLAYVRRTHALVEPLYELDRQERFGPETTGAAHQRFAAERLAAGASMLRDVWYTAWLASADSMAVPRR